MGEGGGLREALLQQLNSLGFALTGAAADASSTLTLARFALGSHLFLTIEPTGSSKWLIGLTCQSSALLGQLPEPRIPFALGRFGASPDGERLLLSSEDIESTLPSLLESAILPLVDSATG